MFDIFTKIKWFLKEHWSRYVIAIIFLNCASFVSILPPKILGLGIDHIVQKTLTQDILFNLVLILLGISIFGYVVAYIWIYLLFGAGNILEYDLRKKFFRHLLSMDAKFFEKNVVGDLMARATSDLRAISFTAGFGVLALVDASVYLIFLLVMMTTTISFKLTLFALLPLPLVAIGVSILGKKIHSSFTAAQDSFSELNNKVLESVSGVRVVRAYVQEQHEINRLEQSSKKVLKKNRVVNRYTTMFEPLFRIAFTISYAITIAYGTYLVFNQQLTPGKLVEFSIYLGMLGWPLFAMGEATNVMQRGNASYDRVNNILKQKSEVVDPENPAVIGGELEKLTFNSVGFNYPNGENKVLDNISFELLRGKTLGIVGRTGSGKTTILRQILHQYDLKEGNIYINNKNIKDLSVKDTRKFFGYVPQEHILFTGTVKQNLLFANPEATNEEIDQAIDIAAFRKDLSFLDNGLKTVVGEHGVTLSGGQKQRLSIARAVLADPETLILDDSLSAVDGTTEKQILRSIKKYRNNRTTIIVAHRMSAVEHAEQIIVLDDGRIVESGSHDDLMRINGWYASQYIHQQMLQKELAKERGDE